ncbi:MAG: DUF2318 domain-containing protein [Synergistaceae bacterium]|nr:DUF2318 domain-containing protein [Synergistaceae bacterium]
MLWEGRKILKYLVSVTDNLAAFAVVLGVIFSFSRRRFTVIASFLGIIAGGIIFGARVYDPRGMNLLLIWFNRWLVVWIAGIGTVSLIFVILTSIFRKKFLWLAGVFALSALIFTSLMYILPPILQYTREFVYFGESGISTNAMLRALGFTLGILVCLLLTLSAYEVHQSLNTASQGYAFTIAALAVYVLEYSASSFASLQRLKVLKISQSLMGISVFDVMIWRDANPNAFLFAQLGLALAMLAFVIYTHLKPSRVFPNKALLRKERARLRDCRRWSWSLCVWGIMAVFIVIVLHYYDTKPPAEVQPEPYDIENGVISVELAKVSDGHLHKFSYVTPGGYDVRFLIVKKPAGTAYGVGLDACDICGIAGYYERGNDEVVCRRCDVVMNKNTIGFKGGCNPVPFDYEVRSGRIYIDVKALEEHEKRFK